MESSHYTCRINGAQVGGPYESISAAKRAASRLAHSHDAPVEVSEMLIHQGHAIESIPGGYRVLPYGETFHDLEGARHWIDEHVRHEVRALERRQNPRRDSVAMSIMTDQLNRVAGGEGRVIAIEIYEEAKGGGWYAVFDTECAALKVRHAYRFSPGVNFGESPNMGGWYVSVRPDQAGLRQNPLRLRDYGRKFRSVGDVRIYFDPDYGEYAVIPAGATDDSGIYFTDDRQDAIATAQAMGMR